MDDNKMNWKEVSWQDLKKFLANDPDYLANREVARRVVNNYHAVVDYFLGTMSKGTIESLSSVSSAGSSGIKKGSSLKSSGVAADTTKTSKSVVTASSRASEAKEDYEWDE